MIGRRIGTQIVVLLLILQLSGCSMGLQTVEKQKISDDQLLPAVSDMIEQQKEVVWPYLEEEVSRSLTKSDPSGKQIVNNTLSEGQGREYLEFCYAVGDPQGEADVETVVSYAHTLLSDEEQQQLEQQLEVRRSLLQARGETLARGLAPQPASRFFLEGYAETGNQDTGTLYSRSGLCLYSDHCILGKNLSGDCHSHCKRSGSHHGHVDLEILSIWWHSR